MEPRQDVKSYYKKVETFLTLCDRMIVWTHEAWRRNQKVTLRTLKIFYVVSRDDQMEPGQDVQMLL
jgi:hypothetical protein